MPISLLALGNPLLDIQVPNAEEFLKKYDLKADDAILVDEGRLGIYEEALKVPNVAFVAGGAAQNTARGAASLLPAGSVAYIGSVGRDVYSEKLLEANAKVGLETHYQFQEDIPTGKCAVLITGHHRSLCTDLAAANHYKVDHLRSPEIWKLAEQARAFYVGGYHLTVSPEAIITLGKHAVEHNKLFSMNMSAPFLPSVFKDAFDSVSPYWDYLIGNESEALSYAESHGLTTKSIPEIAQHLALLPKANAKRPRVVVITQGVDETVVAIADAENKSAKISTYPVHVLDPAKIVDTNGAGDAFAAGFVAALVEDKDLETAVDQGQWLARLGIQLEGPSYPESPKYPGLGKAN